MKPHFSPTQINMYLRCPRQYEERYIKGFKIPPSGSMVQGRTWHKAVEKNYTQKIETGLDLSLEEVVDTFSGEFDRAFSSEEIALRPRENIGALKDQGVEVTKVHHVEIAPMVEPMLVEKAFNVSLGRYFPYTLKGIIDLVEVGNIIVDNKSFSRSPSQADLDKDIQFTAYALAWRILTGSEETELRMDAVVKTKQPKVVQLGTKRTNHECRWLLGLIEEVAKAIQAGTFPPNPSGWHCSPVWCGYWNLCKGG